MTMTKKQRQCGCFGACVGTDSRGFIATYLSPKHRLSKWFQAVSGGLAVIVNTTEFNHSPDHPGDRQLLLSSSRQSPAPIGCPSLSRVASEGLLFCPIETRESMNQQHSLFF